MDTALTISTIIWNGREQEQIRLFFSTGKKKGIHLLVHLYDVVAKGSEVSGIKKDF